MTKEQTIIQQIIHNLTGLPQGAKAYLFGSRARGDYHHRSDWDILILIDKERIEDADFDKYSFPLYLLGWENDAQITPIMYTLKEWKEHHYTPLYKNIEKEGIRLI